jgi:hypothetical protein
MSKKDELLNKGEQRYDLTEEEIVEVASLMALVQQAKAAQDFIYSRIVQNIASRYELVDKEITLNFEEILEQGAKVAKLVVKD